MMTVPAFAYLYTKRNFPARGIIAWATLGEYGDAWRRPDAVHHLARLFNISKVNARILLHRGNGTFWRLTKRAVRPYSRKRLWERVKSESNVLEEEYVGLPTAAFTSIGLMRAYLAQPVLTRGPDRPCSVGLSARLLGRGERSVTTYRSRLKVSGRLKTVPQYLRLRQQELRLGAPPLATGEFIKDGQVYQRTADIVLLINSIGETVQWTGYHNKKRRLAPRRYFEKTRYLEAWIQKGRQISATALLKQGEDWILVANVFHGVSRERSHYISTPHTQLQPFPLKVKRSYTPKLKSSRSLKEKHRLSIEKVLAMFPLNMKHLDPLSGAPGGCKLADVVGRRQ